MKQNNINSLEEIKKVNTKDLLDLLHKEAGEWVREYPEAGLHAFIDSRVAPCLTGWCMSDVEPFIKKAITTHEQQARRDGVEEFARWCDSMSYEYGDSGGNAMVMEELVKKFLEENPSA